MKDKDKAKLQRGLTKIDIEITDLALRRDKIIAQTKKLQKELSYIDDRIEELYKETMLILSKFTENE